MIGGNFKPVGDRVLVQPIDIDSVTVGGIIIPDGAKEKPQKATVVAVGDGRILDSGAIAKMTVKVGDVVCFTQWSGAEINLFGVKYLVMKESDILGILSK